MHVYVMTVCVPTGVMTALRDCWESTSFALEKLQANPECVQQEQDGMKSRKAPVLHATIPSPSPVWQVCAQVTISMALFVCIVLWCICMFELYTRM